MDIRIAIVALLSVTFWTPQSALAAPEVILSLDRAGAIRIPVTIDGQGPWTFLLDTGSSHTMISSEIADRLNLRAIAKSAILTSAGSEFRPVVRIGTISIGSAAAEGLMPSVLTTAQLAATLPGIDGVIGQDFLSEFNYTLDYRRKRLTWTAEVDGTDAEPRLALLKREGRFLVQLAPDRGQDAIVLVPDSGSEAFVIFDRGRRSPVVVEPAGSSAELVAVTGQRTDVREMRLRALRVGSVTVRNQRAVMVKRDGDSEESDGLMPLHFFASVSFNTRESYMVVRK